MPDQADDGGTRTYVPLDTLKPVAADIWIVDSGPMYGVLPVRMTVIRLPDGAVLLHSPTCFSAALRLQIETLGPIRALVAPNTAHWVFLRDWQTACRDARTWAVPGLRTRRQVRRAGLAVDHELTDGAPDDWQGAIEVTMVPGGFGFREAALLHVPSRTLVLTDLVLNIEAQRLPAPLRPLAHLVGMTAPHGRAPVYLRALMKLGGSRASAAAGRLIGAAPERVIFAHGRIFDTDAAERLRRSLGWLAPSTGPLGR
jgi:hypothetical protein